MSQCESSFDRARLLRFLRREFRLDWYGVHGAAHWARVRMNGLAMAEVNGARRDVVELFAWLHDCRRRHEGRDREHGARAADLIAGLNGELFQLDPTGLEKLVYACRHHSDGLTEADLTIQTCWDADRLDLARVGVWPDPVRLCTDVARDPDLMEQAIWRSIGEDDSETPAVAISSWSWREAEAQF
jgi:uncharacterized protein